MNQGKIKCEILKEIRTRIAHENEIPLIVEACTFDGDCKGTCPRCEAELNYLEHKMEERKWSGKKAIVAGISLGLMSTITSCNFQKQPQQDSQVPKDSISNVSIMKETINDSVPPPPGFSENNDRKIFTVSGPIEELAGVSPDLPEVDTQYLKFSKDSSLIIQENQRMKDSIGIDIL